MRNSKLSEEQMVRIARESDANEAEIVAKKNGISTQTLCVWKRKFRTSDVDDVRRLKALEVENIKLKKSLAEQLRAGPPRLSQLAIRSRSVRGMVASSSAARPRLSRCTVEYCVRSGLLWEHGAEGEIVDSSSRRSRGYRIVVKHAGTPTVRKSKFYESVKSTGIMVLENGLGTFEDCESYRNKFAGIHVQTGGNRTVRKSKFYESVEGCGILVSENGLGMFEDCESYRNKFDGIQVNAGGNPTVRKSKFYESVQGAGIAVLENGLGTFEDCESYRNKQPDFLTLGAKPDNVEKPDKKKGWLW